ncbi:MAG: 5'-methylthioadenosine/S-adenosylhomocysteine nucleosidase [Desulfuromonadaceae bacterium]|nr:5'-methylthioadenosine/S-adenosylhomocysteine nucleosidase [Desulfuromonadaceae bacterium]
MYSLVFLDRPVKDLLNREQVARCAELVDMEGAAVAQTAHRFHVPCYLFKYLSDTPGPEAGVSMAARIRVLRGLFCQYFLDGIYTLFRRGNFGDGSKALPGW